MIEVTLKNEDGVILIKAEGHSGLAPQGQDIVCAGVSALVCSFADLIRDLDVKGDLKENYFTVREGYLCVEASDPWNKLDMPYRMLQIGLYEICKAYPENISLKGEESD